MKINFKLPNELKRVVLISFNFFVIISIVLAFINKFYLLTFVLGYTASLINLLKNNIFITYMLVCKVRNQSKRIANVSLINTFITLLLFVPLIAFSFIKNPLYGIFSMVGCLMVKIFIIILYGIDFRKAGGQV